MKSLKESFIKAKDLNNIGAKFDGTFKEGDIILYVEQYFYYYTEDENISAKLNIPTKKNFIRCDNSYNPQVYILDPKRFDSNLMYNGSFKITKIYRNTGKIKPLSKISDWENYVKSKNLKNTINKSSYYILWDRSLQMNESFIKAKDLDKINHSTYCLWVGWNDLKKEIEKDPDCESFNWNIYTILFVSSDRITYWIDYLKKNCGWGNYECGWWAGKIKAKTKEEAKKILLKTNPDKLHKVIEKIDIK